MEPAVFFSQGDVSVTYFENLAGMLRSVEIFLSEMMETFCILIGPGPLASVSHILFHLTLTAI